MEKDMTQQIDLNKYKDFVEEVTSRESNKHDAFIERVNFLKGEGCNISLLMTAAFGLSAESGEFTEVVKKIVFQGKPYNDDNHFHMYRELGDICWYLINACRALGVDPNEMFAENVRKLEARYPGGKFNPYFSENRADNDI
jgi:NTP pyrophosphatase (non-canonical NTP hydrolase)